MPQDVKYILNKLTANSYEAFVVGGCVRDFLLRKEPKDWDITTEAKPEDVKKLFKHTVDSGIKHGTVTVVLNKINYEVTTYRTDGEYLDNRRPEEVFFTTNINEDLLRRDFTINAIAYNDSEGFVDPFGGITDINNKIIRGVGDPDKRFKEDALRMLRAIRFSAQLDFKIDKPTYSALIDNAKLIKNISIERIRDEFIKLVSSDKPEQISLLISSQIIGNVCHELSNYLEENLLSRVSYIKCADEVNAKMALLLINMDLNKIPKLLKFFRFDNADVKNITELVKNLNTNYINEPYEVRKILSTQGKDVFYTTLVLKKIIAEINLDDIFSKELLDISNTLEKILKANDCFKISDLKINGDILKTLGITDGPEIGKTLNYLLDEVMKSPSKNTNLQLSNLVKNELK